MGSYTKDIGKALQEILIPVQYHSDWEEDRMLHGSGW